MTYVQYYDENKMDVLGDRGVVILDGRKSLENLLSDARTCNGWRRPNFAFFRLFKGESFTRSRPISFMYKLEGTKEV